MRAGGARPFGMLDQCWGYEGRALPNNKSTFAAQASFREKVPAPV